LKILPIHGGKVSTYGIMMAIAFLVANFLLQKEFHRLKWPARFADNVIIVGIIGGIIGSKIFFVLEISADIHSFKQFTSNLFSGGGLTWYGGFIVVAISTYFLSRHYKVPVLRLFDVVTPVLSLCYGIGRLGCMVSGDGCYGRVCTYNWPAPLAMSFPNGAAKAQWIALIESSGGNKDIVVFNTPLYAFIFSAIIFLIFWMIRKKEWPIGLKFTIFVIAHAVYRFFIEYLRLNTTDVMGVTQAQFISIIIVALSFGYILFKRKEILDFFKGVKYGS